MSAAHARHVVEQPFSLCEQSEGGGARDVVFFGLGDRQIDDFGRGLERRAEEGLVGPELVPGIGRAAGGGDREQQKHARERRPEPVAPSPRPLGAADDVVGSDANQAGHRLGEAEALAVAVVAQVGAEERHGASVTVPSAASS